MAMRHLLLASVMAAGCTTLRYEAPKGFAEATKDWRSIHYKASDNVGLKLLVFENVEGGTLDYWGEDLVRKLRARAYELREQSPLRTSNDVAGTRFDFVLARDDKPAQFLVVNLFVTDDYLYVAQLAGDATLLPRYGARVPEIVSALRPKGCKPASDVCNGNQPRTSLVTQESTAARGRSRQRRPTERKGAAPAATEREVGAPATGEESGLVSEASQSGATGAKPPEREPAVRR
jgi:hypothetical protein